MSPRKKPAPPPPEPTTRTREGFSTYQTPDPDRAMLSAEPLVWNERVSVYRYRVTVERIDEPREVILARMLELLRTSDSMHHRTALAGEAHRRFGVNLHEMLAAERRATS